MTFYWATSILAKNFGEGLFWWQLSPKFIFWVHENFMMKLNRNSESKQPYVTWGAEIALNGLVGRKSIFETVLAFVFSSELKILYLASTKDLDHLPVFYTTGGCLLWWDNLLMFRTLDFYEIVCKIYNFFLELFLNKIYPLLVTSSTVVIYFYSACCFQRLR